MINDIFQFITTKNVGKNVAKEILSCQNLDMRRDVMICGTITYLPMSRLAAASNIRMLSRNSMINASSVSSSFSRMATTLSWLFESSHRFGGVDDKSRGNHTGSTGKSLSDKAEKGLIKSKTSLLSFHSVAFVPWKLCLLDGKKKKRTAGRWKWRMLSASFIRHHRTLPSSYDLLQWAGRFPRHRHIFILHPIL